MGFRQDFVNALRRHVWPSLHRLFEPFGGYAVMHTTEEEYAMTVHCSEGTLERILDEELGFSRNPLSALKVRVDGNTSEGSWVWRESPLADWQLHLVLHVVDDAVDEDREGEAVDVYAHWEYSWLTHPLKHYATRGYDAEKGVRLAREWLGRYDGEAFPDGLPHAVESPRRRRARELLHATYYSLSEVSNAARYLAPFVDDPEERTEDGRRNVSPRLVDR
ncbi:hypothetical protein ACFPYI_05105 [Halomarina salina]|uniref:DUF4304 domain-containing protein n=1 Tax=Halomarina salina TaxID=1872699 RepID=A0ABD5RJC0_9EURY|nr:hypothetical protein [Halomarina salina]